LEQLNGFELAGRPMKVGNVTERQMDVQTGGQLDNDELDRAGIDLGATGRLQLMAKLAEGSISFYAQIFLIEKYCCEHKYSIKNLFGLYQFISFTCYDCKTV
jgi:hypothetical protein